MTVDSIVNDPSLVAVLKISEQARNQAHALLQLTDNAIQDGASTEQQAEIAKYQKHLLTNISQLRGLHRCACLAARETKAQTAERRQEVDRLHLQLQNLYYEQRHLQGEISACESYEYVGTWCLVYLQSLLTGSVQPQIPTAPTHPGRRVPGTTP